MSAQWLKILVERKHVVPSLGKVENLSVMITIIRGPSTYVAMFGYETTSTLRIGFMIFVYYHFVSRPLCSVRSLILSYAI